jgi:hypothetical protein
VDGGDFVAAALGFYDGEFGLDEAFEVAEGLLWVYEESQGFHVFAVVVVVASGEREDEFEHTGRRCQEFACFASSSVVALAMQGSHHHTFHHCARRPQSSNRRLIATLAHPRRPHLALLAVLDNLLIMLVFLLADLLTQVRRGLSLRSRVLGRDTLRLLSQLPSRALAEGPGTLMAETGIWRFTALGRSQDSQY